MNDLDAAMKQAQALAQAGRIEEMNSLFDCWNDRVASQLPDEKAAERRCALHGFQAQLLLDAKAFDSSLDTIRRGLSLYMKHLRHLPPDLCDDFAGLANDFGNHLSDVDRPAEALAGFSAAVALRNALREQLEPVGQWTSEMRIGLAGANLNRGHALDSLGYLPKAIDAYETAIVLMVSLSEQPRPASRLPRESGKILADAHIGQGNTLHSLGRLDEALAAHEAAITVLVSLREQLESTNQWSPAFCNDLAGAFMNSGNVLASQGRLFEAITAFEVAIAQKESLRDQLEPADQWTPRLRIDLATSHMNLGRVLTMQGRLADAETAFAAAVSLRKSVCEILEPAGQWTPEMRGDLAKAHTKLGLAHEAEGRAAEALVAYEDAIAIRDSLRQLLEPKGQWTPELCNDLAESHMDRGRALSDQGRLADAESAHAVATTLRQSVREILEPRGQWTPVMRSDLAEAHMSLGLDLDAQGRLTEAVVAYGKAIAIRESLRKQLEPAGQWPPEQGNKLAGAHSNRGMALDSLGRLDEAAAAQEAAIAIMASLREQLEPADLWTPELHVTLAGAHQGLGVVLASQGQHDRAVVAFDSVIALTARLREDLEPAGRWTPSLCNTLASAHSNRGLSLDAEGRIAEAVSAQETAITIMSAHLDELDATDLWTPVLRNSLAKAYLNYGVTLISEDRVAEAAAASDLAIALWESLHEQLEPAGKWTPEQSNELAAAHGARGIALSSLGHVNEALAAYGKSVELRQALRATFESVGQWSLELRNDLVKAQANQGNALYAQGRLAEAVAVFEAAIVVAETMPLGTLPDADVTRFTLYANAAALLVKQDEPHDFARTKSRAMADLLELTLPGAKSWDFRRQLREQFARFHAFWLNFCLESDSTDVIPEILAVLQGRDLAAAILDRLDQDNLGTPETVREFQRLRLALRRVNARIRAMIDGRRGPDSPNSVRNLDTIGFDVKDSLPLPTEYPELLSEHATLLARLRTQRDIAAQERGYESLNPARLTTTAALQEVLDNDEALLLFIDLGDGAPGGLVVRREHSPRWHALPKAHLFAKAVQWAGQSLGRGYRDAAHSAAQHRDGENEQIDLLTFLSQFDAGLEDHRETLPRIDPTTAWPQIAAWQTEHLWVPIAKSLDGVTRTHCITHGALHLLPLTAGAPEGLTIARFPGLVFFAERRGVFAQAPTPRSAPAIALSLDVHPGDESRTLIPLVNAEAAALQALYATHGEVARPGNFPDGARPAHLVHLACHGGSDPARPDLAVLHLRPDAFVDEGTLLDTDHPIHDVYINACIAAWTVEDHDGSPSGLISALFQKGAQQVIGALVSISDYWSYVLALLTHQALLADGSSLDASLAEGKHRLATGNWYPDTEQRLMNGMADADLEGRRFSPLPDKLALVRQLRSEAEWGRAGAARPAARQAALDKLLPTLAVWDAAAVSQLYEALANLDGDAWDQAVVDAWVRAERIPPQPDLGALLHGMVVFGETSASLSHS